MINTINKVLPIIYNTFNTLRNFKSNPLADLSFLERGLVPLAPSINTQDHENIIKRLLISYHKAKTKQKEVSLAYKPGGEWREDIEKRRKNYLLAINNNDVSSLSNLLMNFFRNSGVAGLMVYGYYDDFKNANILKKKWLINNILHDMATWRDFVDQSDIRSLSAPPIGNPWGYIVNDALIMPGSCRHHYFANHIKNLVFDIDYPVVAEIGAGFGGFAYYLLSSGIKCKYISFDLPEISLIAQYYIINAFPEKNILLFGETENDEISSDTINSFDIILMPNFALPQLPNDSIDCFVNTGSLSEMDYHTIEEYIYQIARTCRFYFFHENSDRETPKGDGFIEVPSSKFPIPGDIFKRIYKSNSLWGGAGGRYREHLYQRVKS